MIDPANPDYSNAPVSPRRPRFGYAPATPSARSYVTIVTPFYNPGALFHETVQSVLQQSFQQWEWLIVNDGSTDPQSLSMLDLYREGDPRIRVIDHAVNRGLSTARNTGFHAARSRYVVQLDSDDLLEPTAIEKWLWFLESYPEFSFCKGYSVGFGAQEYLWQRGFHEGRSFLEENLVAPTSMIRKDVYKAVEGYDEAIRGGLEDWDFWLRCASLGYWGGTVPEYLDWYRRRETHTDRWSNWDNAERQRAFHERLHQRYSQLWDGAFPQIQLRWHMPNDAVPDELPCENRLRAEKPRLLLIAPWLTLGGGDKFNLDLFEQLTKRGWEVTVATTLKGDHSWLPRFARYTPDVFVLHHFLRLVDYPRFLRYLIASREVDVVLVSHSELGYLLLPYLRTHCPDVTFVDMCHIEEEYWKSGGYPRMAVEYQELLDLDIVVSDHLKQWMVEKGADRQRIYTCYAGIDPDAWRPDSEGRAAIRQELGLDSAVGVVLYAARMCDQKQPRVFAKTMLRLVEKCVDFVAVVAGDGPELGWLRSFVHGHKLESRVRLLGAVDSERVRGLMVASDIFFLPSKWEGIALTLYEGMTCGLPVVGADVGGQCELVMPECGVLVSRSDEDTEAERYAEVLAELLGDLPRCRKMGQAGRRRIEAHFRQDQMAERIISLFREAMQLHVNQPRPIPSLGLARACTAQALEYVRLSEVADSLWREREQAQARPLGPYPHSLDPNSEPWPTLAYFTIRRLLFPIYRRGLDKGLKWLLPVKNRLKQALLHERPS
jgi:glycosyltransferase involved in cell wall biosynthesis/GT2 family glycosyltransferase